jgi:hypothetical protein
MKEVSPNFWTSFYHGNNCVLSFAKKWVGVHFGQLFSQTHLVILSKLYLPAHSQQLPMAIASLALSTSLSVLASFDSFSMTPWSVITARFSLSLEEIVQSNTDKAGFYFATRGEIYPPGLNLAPRGGFIPLG